MKCGQSAGLLRRFASMCLILLSLISGAVMAAGEAEIPVIDAGLGFCAANFTVTDSQKKPLYDAKIEVVIRSGFMSVRKSELQIGTNSDGKARVKGLPEKVKKPLEFRITHGRLAKTVVHNPSAKCNATLEISLDEK